MYPFIFIDEGVFLQFYETERLYKVETVKVTNCCSHQGLKNVFLQKKVYDYVLLF
jgi:hypothetical protein